MPDRSVLSPTNVAIAFLGGLAGAAVFAVLSRGTPGALLLSQLSPLPVMIVALGLGAIHGATAAIAGAVAVTAALGAVFGMSYGLLVALPAFAASYVALGAPLNRRDRVTRRFSSNAVTALCVAVGGATILFAGVNFFSHGELDEPLGFVQGMFFVEIEDQLKEQKLDEALSKAQIKQFVQFAVPAMFAGALVLLHAMNLWIAGRLTQISGMLQQRWPDIAREFELPRAVGIVFPVASLATFLGGFAAEAAFVAAGVSGIALALQGLAVTHFFLRESKAGVATLALLYFVTGALVVPIFLFAILGLFDMGLHFRDRKLNQAMGERAGPDRTKA